MASLGLEYLEYLLSSDSETEIVPESPPTEPITKPITEPSTEPPSTEPPSTQLPSTESTPSFTFPLPPIDQTYPTSEEAIVSINTFARPHGYAVTSKRSKNTKKGVKKAVYLCCDRGCIYIPQDLEKKRRTTTLANNCPFAITLRLDLYIDI
ncbi:hypothetical protein CBS147339_9703 [Penicillium roqueforti]|uniref:Probable transposable element n=1 Tax=Penicillium roqueforti (strain FM164) TaxID=1365484 RepID=W6QKC1_PENRF|nr:uncharacterized protein N7518_009114 [Penicillium psychrosexuale]KAI1832721.1 hypothetical protein CBS147337_6571 [Penicillium roqueforti]CDM36446.1 Probable transposable element [Penicillium roqueforti FM164]KAI2669250.1 hypothetical protein LCP963914a_9956 [Penicillium roqueforti]KAI2679759.1 hypothetical protein CBS147355_4241 [Penicillium roqueforti]KAI2719439.1 hypothetical protein CBS147354_6036 [Penicillium roqueforti]